MSDSANNEVSAARQARTAVTLAALTNDPTLSAKVQAAVSTLCQAIESQPDNSQTYVELAELCSHHGTNLQAIAVCTEAILLDSQCWQAFKIRALCHAKEDHREEAFEDCKRASELSPSVETFHLCSYVFSYFEEYLEAVAACDAAVSVEPENAACYAERASILSEWYIEAESPELLRRAIDDNDTALRLSPDDANYRRSRGMNFMELGEHEKAIEDLTRCAEQDPDFYLNYETRGEALLGANRPQEALADFNHAIKLNSEAAYSFYHRAKVHRILGDRRKADEDEARYRELDEFA